VTPIALCSKDRSDASFKELRVLLRRWRFRVLREAGTDQQRGKQNSAMEQASVVQRHTRVAPLHQGPATGTVARYM
jgi:hypothetical protein